MDPCDPLPPRQFSDLKKRALNKWPCDGKLRFAVKGYKQGALMSYSEAYDAICQDTKSERNAEGVLILTVAGVRRIGALNKLYFPLAKDYIGVALWRMEEEQKRQEQAKKTMQAQLRVGSVEPQPA